MKPEAALNYDDLLSRLTVLGKLQTFAMPLPFMPAPLGTFTYGQEKTEPHISAIVAMIGSMTPAERSLAVPLDESRQKRIARGSGTSIDNVRALEGQVQLMRRLMKSRTYGP